MNSKHPPELVAISRLLLAAAVISAVNDHHKLLPVRDQVYPGKLGKGRDDHQVAERGATGGGAVEGMPVPRWTRIA